MVKERFIGSCEMALWQHNVTCTEQICNKMSAVNNKSVFKTFQFGSLVTAGQCLTVLTISYVDSYRDTDSYVTILPSLPT